MQPGQPGHAQIGVFAHNKPVSPSQCSGLSSADLDHALSHLGKAQGIAQLLAGTVPLLEQGRVYLPADMW